MDSEFYDDVYGRKRLDKDPTWCNTAAARSGVLTTISHNLHQTRRSVLNPFFSKRSILSLESLIQAKVDKLSFRLKQMAGTDKSFGFDVAFMALTSDIITEYAFATCYNYLDDEDFNLAWKDTIIKAVSTGALFRQIPWLAYVPKIMPAFIMNRSPLKQIAQLKRDMLKQIRGIISTPKEDRNGRTVFHAVLDGKLPAEEKTLHRLCDEGQILLGAGSETTAKTLSTISYHLLRNPTLLTELRKELAMARTADNSFNLTQLEQLPFLSAVITEGIRLSGGVTTRTPRVSTTESLVYGDYVIPAGTPISQTAYFVLMDSIVFPSPNKFQPSRWLGPQKQSQKKYMIAFGRGTRNCLGMNLAYAELYMTIAALFGDLIFELDVGVTDDDLKVARDCFVGATEKGRGKILARVKG